MICFKRSAVMISSRVVLTTRLRSRPQASARQNREAFPSQSFAVDSSGHTMPLLKLKCHCLLSWETG